MINICMIDDDKIVTDSVISFINLNEDLKLVKAYHTAESFIQDIDSSAFVRPDILLLDVGLPGMSGTEAIVPILKNLPGLDIIILTTYEEEDVILKAIYNGACSYISKRSGLQSILEAIRIVAAGGSYMSPAVAREVVKHLSFRQEQKSKILTDRQFEILGHLVDGKSYNEIAVIMCISIETVRTHIKKMYRKLHVGNKTAAIAKFMRGEIV